MSKKFLWSTCKWFLFPPFHYSNKGKRTALIVYIHNRTIPLHIPIKNITKKQDSLENLTTEEMQITKTILSDKYGKTIITVTNKLQIGQEKGLIGGYKIIIEDN